eukprot:5895322-Amphidinium_carterae.1
MRLVIDLPQVARHYMKTWFLIDIFIVVPEWIARTLDWVIEACHVLSRATHRGQEASQLIRVKPNVSDAPDRSET